MYYTRTVACSLSITPRHTGTAVTRASTRRALGDASPGATPHSATPPLRPMSASSCTFSYARRWAPIPGSRTLGLRQQLADSSGLGGGTGAIGISSSGIGGGGGGGSGGGEPSGEGDSWGGGADGESGGGESGGGDDGGGDAFGSSMATKPGDSSADGHEDTTTEINELIDEHWRPEPLAP